MKRVTLLFLSLVAIISMQSLSAQNFSVKGKVISEEGNEPLIGVAIVQEGSGNGVITDIDGNYNIEIKGAEQATLTFSYVGMQQQQHTVTANTKTLNITLKSDAQVMDEVVVVAYGVRKKGTIAGSVSTVKSEKLADVPAPSFDQALQGQATGLTVLSQSGEPSAPAVFSIRGTNSINSGTTPLFIMDGMPISSGDFNAINPSDIESISVLKDASATAIYGQRGANGVVLVTTKQGVAGKVKINAKVLAGLDARGPMPEYADAFTYASLANEARIGRYESPHYTREELDIIQNNLDPDLFPNVNWRDLMLKKDTIYSLQQRRNVVQ